LGVVLPMISGKGEEQQTTREVNLLELTAAQQDRLPKLDQPLPPTTLSNDLLANSLPQSWADLGTPSRSSSAGVPQPSTPELPSLNLPPLPPIPSYIDLSSLPPITSSEPILSQLQIDRDRPADGPKNRPRQLPLPPEINSGPVGQLPLPPDLQVEPFRKNRSRTSQLPLATDLQAYRPPGVKSPFSQLLQVEPSVMSPQQFPDFSQTAEGSRSVQSGRSAFEGLPVASALRVVGPLPEKIPQQAIDELRRLQAQNRASNLEGTVAAGIPTGTTVELTPLVEAQRANSSAPKPEAAGLTKIPQQAIDELQRLQAEKQPGTQAATSQTVASPQGATAESQPETVAAKPMVSAPETTPTSEVAKIPERANRVQRRPPCRSPARQRDGWALSDTIATLRQLQQKFAYNPAGTTPAEALASIQAWLDASKKAASNPELLWEPKRITASYPDAASRIGLDKNATDATVGVLVDPEGKISSQPETIESTGYALLNDIAMDAASSYDFAASGEYKAYLLEIKFSHSDSCAGTAASGQ